MAAALNLPPLCARSTLALPCHRSTLVLPSPYPRPHCPRSALAPPSRCHRTAFALPSLSTLLCPRSVVDAALLSPCPSSSPPTLCPVLALYWSRVWLGGDSVVHDREARGAGGDSARGDAFEVREADEESAAIVAATCTQHPNWSPETWRLEMARLCINSRSSQLQYCVQFFSLLSFSLSAECRSLLSFTRAMLSAALSSLSCTVTSAAVSSPPPAALSDTLFFLLTQC
jgi:hypothetical protein